MIQRRRLTACPAPLPQRRPDARKLREAEPEQLRQVIQNKPDLTLMELTAALEGSVIVPTV